MKKYTVVLLRNQYLANLADIAFGQDIYVARVEQDSPVKAVTAARIEAWTADKKNLGRKFEGITPGNYHLCVMFEGHHDPVLWGFETPFEIPSEDRD